MPCKFSEAHGSVSVCLNEHFHLFSCISAHSNPWRVDNWQKHFFTALMNTRAFVAKPTFAFVNELGTLGSQACANESELEGFVDKI